ncbi:rhamnogalacturonan acetylesterase [Gilvimarinus sp. SDUM040013]|uniref:Rhamnogalacturonan acetylesterase n=1 Tax=Gilvimarinus gilvus TaxID=3058038 RepID=A0ABU4RX28_9GAMM|nr:rhamnogalacturonan acetylesterase [Gilvimarinus sp. SDUM040013]MDO3386679.1 rhamnogalacturonan acetylesterase [Gilvimarinus sp. SDUM040013]MDX6849434.1 rhamnogalacturonan acetylesterase [Gilvimarinus sp. SDUM040013]
MRTGRAFSFITIVLTLMFGQPSLAEDLRPRHIHIAGDSTAASYQEKDHQGWGAALQTYFAQDKVTVNNHARGGRSSRTFTTEGLWQGLINDVQPGDLVLIQFGHNDAGEINDDRRARGSLPGLDDEQTDIFNQVTEKDETVYTFGHYIRQMVAEVRAKEATPILLSLTVRNRWDEGRIERRNGQYGHWTHQLAWELDTPFIDVTNLVADKLEKLGPAKVAALYPKDHTHFNAAGAEIHAETIVSALKGLRPTLADDWYSETGREVIAYDWTFLRLPVVASPEKNSIFMVGDSTVRNGWGDGAGGQWGWGDFLGDYVQDDSYNLVNRAIGGFSSRTFVTGGHWQRALNMTRPGDYMLIQFGHNDSAALNDDRRARGTIDGISNAQETIGNMLTGKTETVHTYGWYLRKMIGEAMALGVKPILFTPVPRKIWDESTENIARPEDSYPQWARQVAKQSGVHLIDLHEQVAARYDELGPEQVEAFFADEHTHTSLEGAQFTAEIVADELQAVLPQ